MAIRERLDHARVEVTHLAGVDCSACTPSRRCGPRRATSADRLDDRERHAPAFSARSIARGAVLPAPGLETRFSASVFVAARSFAVDRREAVVLPEMSRSDADQAMSVLVSVVAIVIMIVIVIVMVVMVVMRVPVAQDRVACLWPRIRKLHTSLHLQLDDAHLVAARQHPFESAAALRARIFVTAHRDARRAVHAPGRARRSIDRAFALRRGGALRDDETSKPNSRARGSTCESAPRARRDDAIFAPPRARPRGRRPPARERHPHASCTSIENGAHGSSASTSQPASRASVGEAGAPTSTSRKVPLGMKRPVRRRDDTEIGHPAIPDPEPVCTSGPRAVSAAPMPSPLDGVIGPGLQHDPSLPERLTGPGLAPRADAGEEAAASLGRRTPRHRAARRPAWMPRTRVRREASADVTRVEHELAGPARPRRSRRVLALDELEGAAPRPS